jgi:cell division protein ZapB
MLTPGREVRKQQARGGPIARGSTLKDEINPVESLLRSMEEKVEEVGKLCRQLRQENRELKSRMDEWAGERRQLVEKTAIAKNRVEAMIARLKSMGHES